MLQGKVGTRWRGGQEEEEEEPVSLPSVRGVN
jgi:hypothetical protein